MFGLDDAIVVGKAGVSLIPGIVEVVKEVRRSGQDPSMQAIIDQLVTGTREQCKALRQEIGSLEGSLRQFGLDPTKTLTETYDDVSWLTFVAKLRLNRHRKALRGVETQLSASVDDVVSVLICAGKVADLESAARLTHEVRGQLDGLSERPIGEILEAYKAIIDRWVGDLR